VGVGVGVGARVDGWVGVFVGVVLEDESRSRRLPHTQMKIRKLEVRLIDNLNFKSPKNFFQSKRAFDFYTTVLL